MWSHALGRRRCCPEVDGLCTRLMPSGCQMSPLPRFPQQFAGCSVKINSIYAGVESKTKCMNITENQGLALVMSHLRNQQGKSEGFESCDRPIIRKRPIWLKISDVLSRVTLKFAGWPWKTIGHLSFAVSSFVQHFIAIGEFKLELQSGNAQFESNSTIFRAVWPWNLTDDLEKQ